MYRYKEREKEKETTNVRCSSSVPQSTSIEDNKFNANNSQRQQPLGYLWENGNNHSNETSKPLEQKSNNNNVVQRMVISYSGDLESDIPEIWNYIMELDRAVQEARELAVCPDELYGSEPRIVAWKEACLSKHEKEQPFFHAKFGYAVETLAMYKINEIPTPEDIQMVPQVRYGGTRPDIVLRCSEGDLAWIDITSEASAGHIFRKASGKWKTIPYCYEICYPKLNGVTCIRTEACSIAYRVKRRHLHEAQERQMEQEASAIHRFCIIMEKELLTESTKAETRKHMAKVFGTTFSHDTIRSLFQIYYEWAEISDYTLNKLLIFKGYGRNDLKGRNKAEAEAFIYRMFLLNEPSKYVDGPDDPDDPDDPDYNDAEDFDYPIYDFVVEKIEEFFSVDIPEDWYDKNLFSLMQKEKRKCMELFNCIEREYEIEFIETIWNDAPFWTVNSIVRNIENAMYTKSLEM